MIRKRLTAAQREALYEAEAAKALASGRGPLPICALCDTPIGIGQTWHDNHDRFLPHALGGKRDGISHKRCNELHNNIHATPQVAKAKRIRRKHIGAIEKQGSIRGGRNDPWKRTLHGRVVDRKTGGPFTFGKVRRVSTE